MSTYTFTPKYETVGTVLGCRPIEDLAQEVGVYSATPAFVRKNCGTIANEILDSIPQWYFDKAKELNLEPNCDVRIHRLYPGDFPAYPGWHCDGEFRETYFSQPDLDKIPVSLHITCTVSSSPDGISNARFLDTPITFDSNIQENTLLQTGVQHTLWGQVHSYIESLASYKTTDTKDGDIILFDARSLHKVMPAKIRGWRLFFRMSMWHKPNLGDGGKITQQEQVYKIFEGSGW